MGKDYRIGLIVGSVLAGFALLWVATRPSLTPQPQPVPLTQDNHPSLPKADNQAVLPSTSTKSETGRPVPGEPARTVDGASPGPTARDANTLAKATRFHVVRPGETLSAIAEQYYGSPNAWRKIRDANKTLKDANRIAPGTKLIIPE
jgi:nucleoid-associated protein YgaU